VKPWPVAHAQCLVVGVSAGLAYAWPSVWTVGALAGFVAVWITVLVHAAVSHTDAERRRTRALQSWRDDAVLAATRKRWAREGVERDGSSG
jgi:hypothetical protein